MRGLLVSLIVLAGVIALAPWLLRHLPPGYDPFAPLSVDDPPTFITRFKLERLTNDPAACLAALTQAQAQGVITFLPVNAATGQCPLAAPVRVRRFGAVGLSSSFLASCPLALRSAMFVRQSVIPRAALLGTSPLRVDHVGSYACRNVYHRPQGRLSEHATADALDIAGFRLADGRRITVLNHWAAQDERGDYLRAVFADSCLFFGNSLGPGYNAAHANHFHLGMRGFGVCR